MPLARLPACSRGYVCLHNMATIFVNHRTDKNARPDALDNCYRRVRADLLSIVSRFLFPARISRSRRLVSTIPFFLSLVLFSPSLPSSNTPFLSLFRVRVRTHAD